MDNEQLAGRSQLGQYRLGRLLAAGGMAEVYHADCMVPGRFNRPIVLKRMHEHLAKDPEFVSMFVEEARISSRLDHPNIVRLFDFEATTQGLYIVLEYIEGVDLLGILKAGAKRRIGMPPEIAVYIICHVLEALDYAHSLKTNGRMLKLVHKDVSPGNILISNQGCIKLADFGIAKANDRTKNTDSNLLKGKFGYMSPEQLATKKLDGRSDIFSSSVVLAELLMSKRLFSSPDKLDALLLVRNADTRRLDEHGRHIDPELQVIIRRALKPNRQDRYATAAEFRDELTRWLSSSPNRMSTTVLKEYIMGLESGGYITRSSCGEGTSSTTMSGTDTRAASEAAHRSALAGKEMFERHDQGLDLTLGAAGINTGSAGTSFPTANKTMEPPLTQTTAALPLSNGSLGSSSLLHIISRIFARSGTGLLTITRNKIIKHIYFVDGHPQVVQSNDPMDDFGRFLVARNLLTAKQVHKAAQTKTHFGGNLSNTLVGLELLDAFQALRLVTEQTSETILRSSKWPDGTYSWNEDEKKPNHSAELKLNSCRLVTQGTRFLPLSTITTWISARYALTPDLTPVSPFEAFGFGPSLVKRIQTMDGSRSIAELLNSVRSTSVNIVSSAIYSLALCHDELFLQR